MEADIHSALDAALLERNPDALVATDADGCVLRWNAAAVAIFGYGEAEALGRRFRNLVAAPGPMAAWDDLTAQAQRTGTSRAEVAARRADGSLLHLDVIARRLREQPDPPLLWCCRDATPATLRDAARPSKVRHGDVPDATSDGMFRALLEAAPDAIVITDAEGRIILANSQTDALFGYSRNELIGRGVELLLPERLRHAHLLHRRRYAAEPRVRAMGAGLELFGRHKDGREIPVEISLSPITTEGGEWVSAAIRDITERKRVERQLQEQNLELAQANAAKTTFLAGMSHELRTPLNAINGFTGILLMRLPGPLNEEQEKQLRTVQWAGQHLLALIDDLLDMTRIESGQARFEPSLVDCKQVAQEAVDQLQSQAQLKKLRLSLELPPGACAIRTDRRALRQIVLNLVSNAVKYTDEGSVELRVEADTPERGSVRFTVTDTGIGIRPEDEARLFTAFRQLNSGREARPGAGLGLYLSARLTELLGGEIGFQSQRSGGSVFTLTLPGG